MTSLDESFYAFRALRAGAKGYLMKRTYYAICETSRIVFDSHFNLNTSRTIPHTGFQIAAYYL